MTGGPSQVDTFDYKPELQRRHGQPVAGADRRTGFFDQRPLLSARPSAFASTASRAPGSRHVSAYRQARR